MKHLFLTLSLFCISFLSVAQHNISRLETQKLLDPNGNTVELYDLLSKTRYTFVSIFKTTTAPEQMRTLLYELEAANKKMAPNVEIILIASKTSSISQADYLNMYGGVLKDKVKIYWDSDGVYANDFKVHILPLSFLIRPDSYIVWVKSGTWWKDEYIGLSKKAADGEFDKTTPLRISTLSTRPECLSGNCENGYGKVRFDDYTYYEGPIVNGQPNGIGKFMRFDSTVYEGKFEKGKMVGEVKKTTLEKEVFYGDFVKRSDTLHNVYVANKQSKTLIVYCRFFDEAAGDWIIQKYVVPSKRGVFICVTLGEEVYFYRKFEDGSMGWNGTFGPWDADGKSVMFAKKTLGKVGEAKSGFGQMFEYTF